VGVWWGGGGGGGGGGGRTTGRWRRPWRDVEGLDRKSERVGDESGGRVGGRVFFEWSWHRQFTAVVHGYVRPRPACACRNREWWRARPNAGHESKRRLADTPPGRRLRREGAERSGLGATRRINARPCRQRSCLLPTYTCLVAKGRAVLPRCFCERKRENGGANASYLSPSSQSRRAWEKRESERGRGFCTCACGLVGSPTLAHTTLPSAQWALVAERAVRDYQGVGLFDCGLCAFSKEGGLSSDGHRCRGPAWRVPQGVVQGGRAHPDRGG